QIWGTGPGGLFGIERVANARTREVGTFVYWGAQGAVQQGPWGGSITAYQAIIYKLDSLQEYAAGKTWFAGVTISSGIAGLFYSVFKGGGNTDYNGFLIGGSLSNPPGWGLTNVTAGRISTYGPYNQFTGIDAVRPWLTYAWPPNGILLNLKAYFGR